MIKEIPFQDYRNHLAGCWELYSYLHCKDGKVVGKPHGDHPLGFAQISAEGYSSSHIAAPDLIKSFHPDRTWSAHSDAEISHYSRGISMYCGQIELFQDDQGLFWKTKVDVASDPSRIGGLQVRRVVLSEEDGRHVMTLQPLNAEANVVRAHAEVTDLNISANNSHTERGIINAQMAQVSTFRKV